MVGSLPSFWRLQLAIFLVWGIAWFLAPGTFLSILTGTPVEALTAPAIDQLRMSAPYLLGFAGFTIFALMTYATSMRRGFAAIFAAMLGIWSFANWADIQLYALPGKALAVIPTLLAVVNLFVAIPRPPEWERAENAGGSSTKPPAAFGFWLVQGTVLLSGGLAFVALPELTLSLISKAESFSAVAIHQTRLLGALSLGMVMLSFMALRTQRSFAWRGFAFFFTLFLAVWTLSITWILFQGDYALPVLNVLMPGLLFLPMNFRLGLMRGEWDPGDVNPPSDQWEPLDLIAGPVMAWSVLRTRRRSSHGVGVGASGEFIPTSRKASKGVPSNDFFDGTPHPVRVRFANLTELDDASLDVRGCAIKFSNQPHESPFDLMLNTGSHCPASNLVEFTQFVLGKFVPESMSEKAILKNRKAREGGIAGLRRAPDSYAGLRFHSQIVRFWSDLEGQRHLVRYRCVPDKGDADTLPSETGIPSADDAAHIWLRKRRQSEHRPTDYLRRELRGRIEEDGPVRMKLEAQFHQPAPGDSPEWFNASVDWDETTHPWRELGTLELSEALPDSETEMMRFDPGNRPQSLAIPRASGPWDYRSLGDSEERVVQTLQNLRIAQYGKHGLPAFGEVAK